MRVAHVVSRFPALSHTFIERQIVDQIEAGHEVHVYADGSQPRETQHHPDVIRHGLHTSTIYSPAMPSRYATRILRALPLFGRALLRAPRSALSALNVAAHGRRALALRTLYGMVPYLGAPRFDIVHCHFGPVAVHTIMMQRMGLLQAPLITTFYGYDVHRGRHDRTDPYRPLKEHRSRILALSAEMRRQLVARGFQEGRIHVHHLAIDCERFAYRVRTLQPGEAVRLLSVARLVPKKGLRHAIEAVASVTRAGAAVAYDIIGDGPLRGELQAQVETLGIADRVHLLGWRSQGDVLERLHRAHLFVLPSITAEDGDQEGTPTALMEAMATGLPVISTRHSGIPEVVADGEAGYLVEEGSTSAIEERLRELIARPERWQAMGRAGRAIVEREFNRERLAEQLLDHYRQAIAEQRAG